MKNKRMLSVEYLAALCRELGCILGAGISLADGVALLRDDDDDRDSRALLGELCRAMDEGRPLSEALEPCGRFPEYMLRMLALAERTGRLEPTLTALAEHYERLSEQRAAIRRAVGYPLLLLVIFVVVVAVLIIEVLPIFNEVFRSLGLSLSPAAAALLRLGGALSEAGTFFAVLGAVIVLVVAALLLFPSLRAKCSAILLRGLGGGSVWGAMLSARFASALSIAIASGLDADESIASACELCRGSRSFDAKMEKCRRAMEGEDGLASALAESGIFSRRDSRVIAIGFRTGAIDEVMAELAARGERQSRERLDALASLVEPVIVVAASVVAGVILLSVMLPLAGVMSGLA